MGVQVLTDSTSYLSEEIRRELNIGMISLEISFGDESIREMDIENEQFYKLMAEKGIPISSQPPVGEMYRAMEDVVKTGDALCCIFLSSDMSGTFSTGQLVKKMILEQYPAAQIEIIDSRSNSMQLGFAVIQAARAAQAGKTLAQVKEAALENIRRSRFLFIPHSLEYLQKGGRIGRASALIGSFLKINPILTVENGVASVYRKVRTKKNAVQAMVNQLMEDVSQFGLGEIVVHHINCHREAKELAQLIKEKLGIDSAIVDIGPVIGLHVGPGSLGIAYYTEKNMR